MRRVAVVLALIVLVTACTPPALLVDTGPPSPGPERTTWQLQHRVRGFPPVGHSVTGYDESTHVRVGDQDCFAAVSAPGEGGVDNKLGERTAVTVRGRPGFRSGAGAESAYLTWQRPDDSWVTADCSNPDAGDAVDRVAAAIELRPSSVRLPFSFDGVPGTLKATAIHQDLVYGPTSVYLHPASWQDPGYVVSLLRPDDVDPTGETMVVSGRSVLLDTDPSWAVGVCLPVKSRFVCVRSDTSDSGGNPDRVQDVPTFLDLAGRLRLPSDIDDRGTWFRAEDVFG